VPLDREHDRPALKRGGLRHAEDTVEVLLAAALPLVEQSDDMGLLPLAQRLERGTGGVTDRGAAHRVPPG
jgi:hypothetical protein